MNKDMSIEFGSTIHKQISAARMSEAERLVALNAMRDADLIVDAVTWIVKKIEHLGERWFLKPSLGH